MLANWSIEIKREWNSLKKWDEGKEDHGHSQKIKFKKFNISLWDKRKEILYLISIATKAFFAHVYGLFLIILITEHEVLNVKDAESHFLQRALIFFFNNQSESNATQHHLKILKIDFIL